MKKKYEVVATAEYRRCRKRVKKRQYRMELLDEVIDMLAAGEILPVSYDDHALGGEFRGCRECHVTPDWLLVYRKYERELILMLMRTGTHSDFKFGEF